MNLVEEIQKWAAWSRQADQTENGWESDYPEWVRLMSLAEEILCRRDNNTDDLLALNECWAISNESEWLSAFSKENLEETWENLTWLAKHGANETRWQVYDVMGTSGSRGIEILRAGLLDSNPYCLRRAILALSELKPVDAKELAQKYMHHSDKSVVTAAKVLEDCLS